MPETRRDRVLALYASGHRQAAIARDVGISPERVRQILNENGIPTPAEQREADFRLATEGREGDIEMLFWELRDFSGVGHQLHLDPAFVRRVLDDLWPDIEVFREIKWGDHQQFTDRQLLSALRQAAASPGVPSPMRAEDYDAWVDSATSDEPRPASVTIMARFGNWRPALMEAGLPANERRRGPGQFTLDACVAALAHAWRELHEPPSMAQYQRWHESHPGSPGGDMVRARARGWGAAKMAAYPLVHGKSPLMSRSRNENLSSGTQATPTVGRAYRPREIACWRSPDAVHPADPAVIERGVRSHFDLEAMMAGLVEEAGFIPLSPTGADPPFDLAWRDGNRLNVVEVKSATATNVEAQTRLGFGQILRYCEELRVRGEEPQPILSLELSPDRIWDAVADRHGVWIVHPAAPLRLATMDE